MVGWNLHSRIFFFFVFGTTMLVSSCLKFVAGKAMFLFIPLQWSRKLLAAHKFVRNGKEEDYKHQ
jgi:hypothetical protein